MIREPGQKQFWWNKNRLAWLFMTVAYVYGIWQGVQQGYQWGKTTVEWVEPEHVAEPRIVTQVQGPNRHVIVDTGTISVPTFNSSTNTLPCLNCGSTTFVGVTSSGYSSVGYVSVISMASSATLSTSQ